MHAKKDRAKALLEAARRVGPRSRLTEASASSAAPLQVLSPGPIGGARFVAETRSTGSGVESTDLSRALRWDDRTRTWVPERLAGKLGDIGAPMEGDGGTEPGDAAGDVGIDPPDAGPGTRDGIATGDGVLAGGLLAEGLASAKPYLPPPPELERLRGERKCALVLSGGNAHGAFQVGVLKHLYKERRFSPQIITSCSVGSVNGAKLAEGPPRDEEDAPIDRLERLWGDITGDDSVSVESRDFRRLGELLDADLGGQAREELYEATFAGAGAAVLPIIFPVAGSIFGWIWSLVEHVDVADVLEKIGEVFAILKRMDVCFEQEPLRDLVNANIKADRIMDSGIVLRMATVHRDTGLLRWVTERGDIEDAEGNAIGLPPEDHWSADGARFQREGRILDGIMASSAIPIWFAPWPLSAFVEVDGVFTGDGGLHWDGAIRENVPVSKALELGATDLVVVATAPPKVRASKGGNLPVDDVKALTRMARVVHIETSEVTKDDLAILDTIDLLHRAKGSGADVSDFQPFPRGLGMEDVVPDYVLIAPPFTLGGVYSFDPNVIKENIDFGEMIARHAFSDLSEAQQREEIFAWLHGRLDAFWAEVDEIIADHGDGAAGLDRMEELARLLETFLAALNRFNDELVAGEPLTHLRRSCSDASACAEQCFDLLEAPRGGFEIAPDEKPH